MTQPRLWAEHPLQNTYRSMLTRCYCKSHRAYAKYGNRGITVCDRWLINRRNGGRTSEGFQNFIADMGPKPSKAHSLDRIDNNKGYSPENCRWATKKEQQLNRNKYKNKGIRGEKHPNNKLSEEDVKDIKIALAMPCRGLITRLAKKYGVDRRNIYAIKNGETWDWI